MIGTPGQIKVINDQIMGDGAHSNALTIVTSINFTLGKYKTRTLELRGGVVTLIGAESTWTSTT